MLWITFPITCRLLVYCACVLGSEDPFTSHLHHFSPSTAGREQFYQGSRILPLRSGASSVQSFIAQRPCMVAKLHLLWSMPASWEKFCCLPVSVDLVGCCGQSSRGKKRSSEIITNLGPLLYDPQICQCMECSQTIYCSLAPSWFWIVSFAQQHQLNVKSSGSTLQYISQNSFNMLFLIAMVSQW